MTRCCRVHATAEHEVRIHLRIAKEDVVVLGGILLGYEGLVSLQGEPKQGLDAPHVIALVTTSGLLPQLEDLLVELAHEVRFERITAANRVDEDAQDQ